jgi:hypothetical protein
MKAVGKMILRHSALGLSQSGAMAECMTLRFLGSCFMPMSQEPLKAVAEEFQS